jgi:hypothetical protein
MTTFFHIKSTVKHNGTTYTKDSVLQGELVEFQTLVNDGLFAVLEGAETLEEAEQIVADSKITPEAQAKEDENTWGPKDKKENTPEGDGLDELTKKDLLKIAKKEKVEDVKETTKNGDIVEAIRAARIAKEKGVEPYTGPMVKVKFIQEYEVVDENNEKTGEIIAEGEEKEVPEPVVEGLVDGGFAEVVEDKNTASTNDGDGGNL